MRSAKVNSRADGVMYAVKRLFDFWRKLMKLDSGRSINASNVINIVAIQQLIQDFTNKIQLILPSVCTQKNKHTTDTHTHTQPIFAFCRFIPLKGFLRLSVANKTRCSCLIRILHANRHQHYGIDSVLKNRTEICE